MQNQLERDGYQRLGTSAIFARPEFTNIAYSDGDEVENRLLSILKRASDLSIYSHELAQECIDWPSTYHFSSTRSNLVRPFTEALRGDVIELGAGCGAITRFLGETANSVVAVEGSMRRCEINAERVRDLKNVQVVASELTDFETEAKFDAVVVVGVLEYAGLFIDGENPHKTFLEKTKSLLKPGGKLFLAIENKVGLKYFAGAPEDHLGQPMVGIEDRYPDKGVQTFSKRELLQLTKSAGFASTFTHAPVPDYKLTRALITEQGLASEEFNAAELFSQLVHSDPQIPAHTGFDLKSAWRAMGKAGLVSDLTNSFMMECSATESLSVLAESLAFFYGGPRVREYVGEKVFRWDSTIKEVVVADRNFQGTETSDQKKYLSQVPDTANTYFKGQSYAEKFEFAIANPDWKLEEVQKLLSDFLSELELKLREREASFSWPDNPKGQLDSGYLDLVPSNVKQDAEGNLHIFDLEWKTQAPIEFGFLLFRIASNVFGGRVKEPWSTAPRTITLLEAIYELLKPFGLNSENLEEYVNLEYRIQQEVVGSVPARTDYRSQFDRLLSPMRERDALLMERGALVGERDALLMERGALVGERDALLMERGALVGERDALLMERGALVGERDALLMERDSLLASLSWRATSGLRRLAKPFVRSSKFNN
jgi:SAM-dependent methyltransferase